MNSMKATLKASFPLGAKSKHECQGADPQEHLCPRIFKIPRGLGADFREFPLKARANRLLKNSAKLEKVQLFTHTLSVSSNESRMFKKARPVLS